MELLYFIIGILSAGILYCVKLLNSVKSSHTEMLARHQSQLNISSIRNIDIDEAIGDLKLLVMDIQSNMEKDQYESLAKINTDLKMVSELANSTNNRLGESNRVFTKNASDAFTEIQQLKSHLKAVIQGPNMTSNY